MQGNDSLPVLPLHHLLSLKRNGIDCNGKNPHFFPFVPWLHSSILLVTLMGEMPFILAQDTERMPPLMFSDTQSTQSWSLGPPVPWWLCDLALDNFGHGCRTQQFRIHKKESWEEVSDTRIFFIFYFTMMRGLWKVWETYHGSSN
jgi:hypothetical protein